MEVSTFVDSLIFFLQRKKKANLKELQGYFKMTKDELLGWLKPLEKQGLVKIHYGLFSTEVELLVSPGIKQTKRTSELSDVLNDEIAWVDHLSSILSNYMLKNKALLEEVEKRKEMINAIGELCHSLTKLQEILDLVKAKGKCPQKTSEFQERLKHYRQQCMEFFSQDFRPLNYPERIFEATNILREMFNLLVTAKDDFESQNLDLAKAKLKRYFDLKKRVLEILSFE
jgi:hypothetical protein